MLTLTIDFDPVTARRNGFSQTDFFIQLRPHLVKIRDLQTCTLFHRTAVRCQFAQNQFQQGGFARTVRPDQTDFIATHQRAGELLYHALIAVDFADSFQLCNDLAGTFAGSDIQFDLTLLIAACTAFQTHLLQTAHTAFITATACFYTFTYPDFFLRQ